jgi:predicted aspartyl protease
MRSAGPLATSSLIVAVATLIVPVTLAPGPAGSPAPIAVIPFRWTPGQIEVQVSVNGDAPAWFILDTGAEFSILDEPLVNRLGLTTRARLGRRFASGVSLRLGTIELHDQDVMVFALENFHRQRRSIVGVLGYDLFRRYVVSIDYAARTLAFHEPATYGALASASSIPIAFAGRLGTVPVTITLADSTPIQATVILDTGASQTLILRHPFAESHGLLQRAARHPATRAGSLETTTVTFARLPVRQLTLGDFSFLGPVLRLYLSADGAGGSTETDGALGNEVLRRFTATFDYSRGRLYLKANSSIDEPLP